MCTSINMAHESYSSTAALQAACVVLSHKWVLTQEEVHAARVFARCMRRAGAAGECCCLMDAELRVMAAAGWRMWLE